MDTMKAIGQRIKALRQMKGYTVNGLADRLKIGAQTLGNIENGANTTINTLEGIAAGLEIPFAALMPVEEMKVVSASDFHLLKGDYDKLCVKHEAMKRIIRHAITE
jgi:transcriptional regulator with XRE-family HTH domain